MATADHRHRRVGYGRAGDDGRWAPQSPLGPSPDRHQVPGPASIRTPPAATSRVSVDTPGSYDSHNSLDRRAVGHRRRARLPQPREAAARDRRHQRCEVRPSARLDAASPRSSASSPRLYAAHNPGDRRRSRPRVRRGHRNRGKRHAATRGRGHRWLPMHSRNPSRLGIKAVARRADGLLLPRQAGVRHQCWFSSAAEEIFDAIDVAAPPTNAAVSLSAVGRLLGPTPTVTS